MHWPSESPESESRGDTPAGDDSADQPPNQPTILIVEDSDDVRRAVSVMLESEGYVTVQAKSGAKALEEWDRMGARFSLVLADMFMPGMDGLTFARELRARAPKVPIILVSGRINEHTQRSAEEAGFSFLGKPFQSAQLFETLQYLLTPPKRGV